MANDKMKTDWKKDLRSLLFDFADGYYAKGIGKGKLSEKDYWKRVNDWCKRLFYPLISQELKRERKRVLEDIKDWLHAETITIKADFNGYSEELKQNGITRIENV